MEQDNVGILTFHDVRNYGASLQAYALQQKAQETFSGVEIIQYQNQKIQEKLRLWERKGSGAKSYLRAAMGVVFRLHKKHAFDAFNRKKLCLSERVQKEQLPTFAQKYDVLITGSDQVWCTDLTNSDMRYFLDFARADQIKIAYAPSFGDDAITDLSVVKYLNQMDLLTTREEITSKELLARLTKAHTVVCDPTLLLGAQAWGQAASRRLCKEPYVFLFMIHPSAELIVQAEKFCQEKNLKLISNKSFAFFRHPSPMDFLSWVKYADFVFTDSFHGTVFSLIFQKQFACHCYSDAGKKKLRLLKLLELVHLPERTLDNLDFRIERAIPWAETQKILDDYAAKSWGLVLDWFEKYGGE